MSVDGYNAYELGAVVSTVFMKDSSQLVVSMSVQETNAE